MLRYRDLSEEQKKKICNGCGAKGSWIKVPDFRFVASCDQHDFYYWRGGQEYDRKIADDEFYIIMKRDIKNQDFGWSRRVWYRSWAWTYYKAVRYFGKSAFAFGEMKTIKDL